MNVNAYIPEIGNGHGFLLRDPSQVTRNGSTVSLKYYGK